MFCILSILDFCYHYLCALIIIFINTLLLLFLFFCDAYTCIFWYVIFYSGAHFFPVLIIVVSFIPVFLHILSVYYFYSP
jgi:hypothetical protein